MWIYGSRADGAQDRSEQVLAPCVDRHLTMTTTTDGDLVSALLRVVAQLLRGNRQSRRTIREATGRSLSTADRWIEHIAELPGVRRVREGKTLWLVYDERRDVPPRLATIGACIAASLGALFEGSQQERNLRDARDYLLRLRGDDYGDLDRKFFFAPKGGEYALPEKREELDEIIDAIIGTKVLAFAYRHNDGQAEAIRVDPLSLVIFDHQFYVLGRRPGAPLYCYRFARMSNVEADDVNFVYPSKNEYDPRALFGAAFGVHVANDRKVEDVEIILSEPWASYALTHRWHPTQQVTRVDSGHVSVTLRVRPCRELETWALGFGEHARVERPAALRTAVARRHRAAVEAFEKKRPTIAKVRGSREGMERRAKPRRQ